MAPQTPRPTTTSQKSAKPPSPTSRVLLAAAIAIFAALGIYQFHPSGELKQILSAALSHLATPADMAIYQPEARAAVRTIRDRQLDRKFEKILALTNENCDQEQADFRDAQRLLDSQTSLLQTYKNRGQNAAATAAAAQINDTINKNKETAGDLLACQKRVQSQKEAIPRLATELKSALGTQ